MKGLNNCLDQCCVCLEDNTVNSSVCKNGNHHVCRICLERMIVVCYCTDNKEIYMYDCPICKANIICDDMNDNGVLFNIFNNPLVLSQTFNVHDKCSKKFVRFDLNMGNIDEEFQSKMKIAITYYKCGCKERRNIIIS